MMLDTTELPIPAAKYQLTISKTRTGLLASLTACAGEAAVASVMVKFLRVIWLAVNWEIWLNKNIFKPKVVLEFKMLMLVREKEVEVDPIVMSGVDEEMVQSSIVIAEKLTVPIFESKKN